MFGMIDYDDLKVCIRVVFCFDMDFVYKWVSGVYIDYFVLFGFGRDDFGDIMGWKDYRVVIGVVWKFFDKYCVFVV